MARRTLRNLASFIPLCLVAALTGCSDPAEAPASALPAPAHDVELLVDDMGISHVYAKSDADAFFGAGYAMARDRLFQMELFRRRARGTRAELLGQKVVKDDILTRTVGFPRLARADEAALIDAWTAGVNRRIEEVRRGEAPRPYGMRESELDFVPEPWETWEAYAVGKLLAFGLSNNLDRDILTTALARMAPDTAARFPALMPAYDVYPAAMPKAPAPPAPGPFAPPGSPKASAALFPRDYRPLMPEAISNNWAVDGTHTDSGKPYVCGDPHQDLTSPTRLWPLHMNSADAGGTLDVAGFAFVGTPTVELGHNAHLGWTATTNFADVMDLWDVQPDPAFTTVTLGGKTVTLSKRDEVIRVKADGAKYGTFTDDVTVEVADVPGYGVILPDEMLPIPRALLSDGRLLFNWTGFAPSTESVAYLAIDRAENIDEFEAAVERLEVGAVNFVAADAKEIDYHVHARVPDRGDPSKRPMPWKVITDVASPDSYWTRGDLPDDEIPNVRAPANGYIFTANTDPFGFTADGKVEDDPFYYGAFYANGFRAYRIQQKLEELLAQGAKVDRAKMEDMQRDIHSPMADTVVPLLDTAIAQIDVDPKLAAYKGRDDLKQLAARLSKWDRRMARDQAEPSIFAAMLWFASKRAFREPLTPSLFGAISTASPPFLTGMLRNVLLNRFQDAPTYVPDGVNALLLASLDDTAGWLKARFGAVDATFKRSDLHSALFQTEFEEFGGGWVVAPMAVDGGEDTINVSPAAFLDDQGEPLAKTVSTEMALYRMVVGFGADGIPEATVNFARGTSEEPGDPHFGDQDESWTSATYKALAFKRADVDTRMEGKTVIGGGK
jgi:penicillin amidase